MFSTPETSVHVLDKNREISPLEKELYSDRQIGVADYIYVVSDDPLQPGHVTRRMRIASFAIKMAHLHCLHPLRSNGSS